MDIDNVWKPEEEEPKANRPNKTCELYKYW